MCYHCWVDAGRPTSRTQAVVEVAERIRAFDDQDGAGEVVLGDWNLDDHALDYWFQETNDPAALGIIASLRTLTMHERRSALALAEEFLDGMRYGRRGWRGHLAVALRRLAMRLDRGAFEWVT